ncbi:hypothetical protein KY495_23155 [Massilia sp. PAMC28688]|uniref:hypothetical protein n=1 Tax=Massilia sp. PAMC28688 TaxID=2861283 RepID=UPI001C636BEE|nr:hypothetical protein [Massilia sp. PAMC28688]QYF93518.1 hypothetical protein KY495_23155 [Massilia sp. PAMC28688]
MTVFDRLREYRRLARVACSLLTLPRARLRFDTAIAPTKIRSQYELFNRPHARFPLMKNKTMGIALIDLSNFKNSSEYLATVKKKDYAGHHARQARKRGYTVRRINRNDHVAEIFRINTSSENRQGRPMDLPYLTLQTEYEEGPPMQSYGVFNAEGLLTGYCCLGMYGNFAATDRLIGLKTPDGAMYLLLVEIICTLIDRGQVDYFMYDTFLGAQPGLKSFKHRIGFQPFRVKYSLI